jgi:toxin CptA
LKAACLTAAIPSVQHHHSAPPVQYPVQRSRFQGTLLCGAALLEALVLLLWTQSVQDAVGQSFWRVGLGALACVATWGMALSSWRRTSPGTLAWDGVSWRFETQVPVVQEFAAGGIAAISVHLDFQSVILARLHAGALDPLRRSLWIWLERRSAPAQWKALRRAVLANGASNSARIGA